jgi:hypothetical protein
MPGLTEQMITRRPVLCFLCELDPVASTGLKVFGRAASIAISDLAMTYSAFCHTQTQLLRSRLISGASVKKRPTKAGRDSGVMAAVQFFDSIRARANERVPADGYSMATGGYPYNEFAASIFSGE